ncbi:hypothetical protein BaRGS_00026912 [Batillaria attramentaria]|uniref:Uncharacterized protein n=1 Tax=Batillaria attramentaria TaxID=370345 RepID=A0ABD0K4N2_9CAEN
MSTDMTLHPFQDCVARVHPTYTEQNVHPSTDWVPHKGAIATSSPPQTSLPLAARQRNTLPLIMTQKATQGTAHRHCRVEINLLGDTAFCQTPA